MSDELQQRLRRLGVVKGTRDLKPAADRLTWPLSPSGQDDDDRPVNRAPVAGDPPALEQLLPGGRLVETKLGACFVLDHVYPLTHGHGQARLEELPALPTQPTALFCHDERLGAADFREFLFLDTETTGLGGAGTLAFMVGTAFFAGEAFVVRQYFLRDHGDEAAMLWLLAELLAGKAGLITFNGRSFDVPLLESRYILNRLDVLGDGLSDLPHLDLLPPARRLWRQRLDSCALSSLEEHILEVKRTEEDVPGWLIPGLYLDYLRSGDPRPLLRVFYHNQIDMLSMVVLASRIVRQFAQPLAEDHPVDLLSLGRWQTALKLEREAEETLRMATSQELPLALYHQALIQLGGLLKRADRRAEAVPLWQQVATTTFDDVTAHVELAMFYEWHEVDLEAAQRWTEQALVLTDQWPKHQASLVQPELSHRLARLRRKLAGGERA